MKRFRQAECTMIILRETVLVVPMVDSCKPGHYNVRGNGDTVPYILVTHGDRREFQSPNPVALQLYRVARSRLTHLKWS